MSKGNVSGDSKIVCGAPVPSESGIDIPPKRAGEMVIEEGEVVIEVKANTPELVDAVNKKYNKEDREH